MLKPGRCSRCNTLIWRTASDPNNGRETLLWPMPTSRYAIVRHERDGSRSALAVGIPHCAGCVPDVSAVSNPIEVVESETAKERYGYRFSPAYGSWLESHARDYLKMDEAAITTLLATWEHDRA